MVLRNLFRRKSEKTQEEKMKQVPKAQVKEKEESIGEPVESEEAKEALEDEGAVDRSPSELEDTPAQAPGDPPAQKTSKVGLFARLKRGLAKTRTGFVGKMDQLFARSEIDEDVFEELEALMVQADMGVHTTLKLIDRLRDAVKERRLRHAEELRPVLAEFIEEILSDHSGRLALREDGPTVYLVVGVNGAGKTTTIGKLAHRFKQDGKKVLLGAADTFRAAAIEQLEVWAQRAGVDTIKHQEGSDPAAVAFDSIQAGKARNADVIIIDTAGRLQNKTNLMKELSKVHRVVERELGRPADEVLLVVDATTGQNALSQARLFGEAVPITAVALTKLDGTAKGGIVVAIADELGLPIKLIGIGEGYDDLRDFDPHDFVAALFDTGGRD